MSRYLLVVVLVTAIVADGYLCGRLSGRWNDNQEAADAAVRLQEFPLTIGKWRGRSEELDPKSVERAGFSGYVWRQYTHQGSHATVNMLLACGRPGPLSVHTPEVCYGGAGFAMVGNPEHWALNVSESAKPAEFWKATFMRRDASGNDKLRVIWSWNHYGAWNTAEAPRWTYAGTAVLYKLYVTQMFTPHDEATDGEACLEFIRDCQNEFDKVIAHPH